MKSTSTFFLSALVAATLAACGGGGGDSGGTTTPTGGGTGGGTTGGGTTAATISSTNQPNVARATVVSGVSLAQMQSASINRVPSSSTAAVALASDAVRHAAALSAGRVHALDSTTVNCAHGGTLVASYDGKGDGSSLVVGDVISATFTNCSDVAGVTINGGFSTTVTSGTALDQWISTAVLTKFTITDGTRTTSLDGSLTLAIVDTDPQNQTTMTVGANGLTIAVSSPSYTDSISYAAGMRVVQAVALPSDDTALTIDGTFTATSLGGPVTVATLTPVVQRATDDFPSSGQVRVTGANSTRLLITALDATQVRLSLDANGDGVYESNSVSGWTDLLPN